VSYEVEIYLPAPVPVEEVVGAVRGSWGFTVDGPLAVEPEDVPAGVAARVLGASVVYLVNADAAAAVPVRAWAKRVARAHRGGVWDPQTEEAWSAAGLRKVPRPPRLEGVDVVTLRWWLRAADTETALVAFLDQVTQFLPEALPRRYGVTWPLKYRLEEGGVDSLRDAWVAEEYLLFFQNSQPFLGGSFVGGSDVVFGYVGLKIRLDALIEPGWRRLVKRLFVEVGQRSPVVYADAVVSRGWSWSGTELFLTGRSTAHAPENLHHWSGLHPSALWWGWYGPEYAAVLAPYLPGAERFGEALFLESSELPAASDGLPPTLIPAEYRCTRPDGRGPEDVSDLNEHLIDAKTAPAPLR